MSLRRTRSRNRLAKPSRNSIFNSRSQSRWGGATRTLEFLESRCLMAVDTSNSDSAMLSIWVNGSQVAIPANVGVNANDTHASVFTTAGNGTVFFDDGNNVTLGDFFTTWRTNAGLAGNNANAIFNSSQLMTSVTDRTHTLQVFVNGQLSSAFENEQIEDSDSIVLVYSTNTVVSLNTNFGSIVVELFDAAKPITVTNFLNYVNDGDYVNSIFHRTTTFATAGVAVIQGGGFETNSTTFTNTSQFTQVPTDPPIQNEPGISNLRGTIAMAKTSDPNSATSQFFVNLDDGNSVLDNSSNSGGFTVFGNVLDMTTADVIGNLPRRNQGGVFSALPVSATDQLAVVQSVEGHGEVSGFKFHDTDGDGVFDPTESGVAGQTVWVDANNNGLLDSGEASAITASDGYYEFHLEPGTYTLRATVSTGLISSLPGGATSRSATTEIGGSVSGVNFGETPVPTPDPVDLVALSDTGALSNDNVTKLNNSSASTAMQFLVPGVTAGALVRVFANGVLIGSATASSTEVTITTDGTTTIADGLINFTATQSIGNAESDSSADLHITIDTAPPADITSTPTSLASANQPYTYDANSNDENLSNAAYSLVGAPVGMTIDDGGVVTWTPTSAQTGPVQFQILLADAAGNTTAQNVAITVLGDPPARPDSYSVDEDSSLVRNAAAGVLANDGNGGPTGLTAQLVAGPAHGTLNFNDDGSFTYTPADNFFGTDVFTYTASNGSTTSNVAQVTITVNPLNDPPAPQADSYTTNEDGALTVNADLGVLDNDTDVDSNSLTAAVASNPSNGTLTLNSDGSFTYTPNGNFFGTDTFTYTASDGTVSSDPVLVSINVTAVNDPPVAADNSYSVNEGVTLNVNAETGILSGDSDVDGDTLTAVLASQPSNGLLTLNGDGSFTYTPNVNFFGSDSFTYRASDSQSQSELRTVTITVVAQPDPPTAVNDNFSAPNNGTQQTFDVLANDSSAPDAAQTLTIVGVAQGSAGGTVAINGSTISYTAATSFSGTETFTYTVQDTDNLPTTATVTVTVSDTSSNNTISGFVYTDKSLDGVRSPSNAGVPGSLLTLTGTTSLGASVTRTALTDNSGFYSFANLASGTYAITQSASSATVDGKLTTTNATGAVKTDNKISNLIVSNGATLSENNFVEKSSSPSYVSISWYFASAAQQQVLMREAMAKAADAAGNSTLAAAIRAGATTLDSTSTQSTALAETSATGLLSSTTTSTTNTTKSAADVSSPNKTTKAIVAELSPQTNDLSYSTSEDQSLIVEADAGLLADAPAISTASDDEDDQPIASLVSAPEHGTVEVQTDGSFVYTPEENFHGIDTFQTTVGDSSVSSVVTTALVSVEPVNDAPLAVSDHYQAAVDSVLSIEVARGLLSNDADIDGDSILASLVSGPTSGTLELHADGSLSYSPHAGFVGTDSFCYQVTDGELTSLIAEVLLEVLSDDSDTQSLSNLIDEVLDGQEDWLAAV